MFKLRIALPALLTLALAAPLAAQEETPAPKDDLAMGEEINEVKPYFREESGDWKLECLSTGEEDEPCQLFQAAIDPNGNQLSNMRLFKLPEGGEAVAGSVIAFPLEILLTAQMTMTIDDGPTKRYPFSVCDPLGCYSRIGFTQEDIDGFKRGSNVVFEIVPFVAPNERMIVTMSLKGFTAGYDKITVADR
ncbi:MAG: invasion associated locus B family protein [Thalassovita sp.]